ncbi:hypothetical protein MTP02_21890 [Streptomyces albus]|uniref:Uncharacterized protein n=1 Tax=Streptomyces albidoflavus TaxID=1886 RepID=A0AA37BXZ4_9ACTN|nr:hypothetical protein MTP02_21890 [Streptomyces albus]GHI46314.1 hypothetical protein ScoT_24880 [Streptomyces albidoflavus]
MLGSLSARTLLYEGILRPTPHPGRPDGPPGPPTPPPTRQPVRQAGPTGRVGCQSEAALRSIADWAASSVS